ncbi:elongation factor G [Methylocaldum gracile subsp. desertum]|uniref:elongation factor G n=1 Tax=Methylocaldum sp. GT1BW TaxID=3438964 RepID=UPI003DA13CC5
MNAYSTEDIRTIALVGHAGAGKTTLVEALLYKTGMINTPGSVEKGTTVCDYDPLEKAHQHSQKLAVTHIDHKATRIHLLDTPGYPDFMGQALCALDAVETAAVVINAANGIEFTTGRMMQWAQARGLCRMIVVNKIDGDNLNLPELLKEIRDAFGKECLPINLPADKGTRVIDCFFNGDGRTDFSSPTEAHGALIDQVVEVDEELMTQYLEQGEIAPETLHAPFEEALRNGHLVPICFVSARTGVGVPELADAFVKLLPNPKEGNPPLFERWPSSTERKNAVPFRSEPDASKHALAHVFKVEMDPYVGKISVFRIHQGTVVPDTQLFIGESRKPFKAGHLFMLQGKQHVPAMRCIPGDICAVAKVDEIEFDSVLHDTPEDDHIHLKPLDFPHAVFGLAITPKRRGDEHKLSEVLHKLEAEDPALDVEYDATTHEEVMHGLGELHLQRVLEKMQQQYKLEVDTHPPKIPYRETITSPAEGHHRHKKQTGGAGQFGEVFLRIEPLPRGAGFEFVDEVKGGAIPGQFIPAVEKGVRQALETGAVAGYPIQDVRVVVYDGKAHPVDSKEVAFVAAGKKAFQDAVAKARPIVLEPVVNVEISIPESTIGDVTGDLSSRRGQVTGTAPSRSGMTTVAARAPLAELSSYHSRLKSLTAGQGSYTLEFSHYEPVSPHIQQQLMGQYRPRPED